MAVATSEPEPVTKNLYEGMFLLDSSKFASNPEEVTQHLLDILEKAEGEVVAQRPWLDGRLAYEIEGKRRGVHYLVYFRMPGSGVADVTRSCKLSDTVMRHLVIRHEQMLFDAMVAALDTSAGSDVDETADGDAKAAAADGEAKAEVADSETPEAEVSADVDADAK